MRTPARNYRKNPHTANFLMTFHSAAYGLANEVSGDGAPLDLLDSIDIDAVVDARSEGQTHLMAKLHMELAELDRETAEKAVEYTTRMTLAGAWTPGREGNASVWISRMIAKVRELKAATPKVAPQPSTEAEIPANYYGITHEGEVKCYQVDYGKEGTRWEGFTFLSRVSSDDRFPVRNAGEKARILDTIRENVEAAQILAGLTMRRCRRCGRGLSDTKNPYFSVALGPDCGAM